MQTSYVHLVPMLSAATPLHSVCTIMAWKSTVHHRTDHEGPEREQRYSSILSLISVLDRDGFSEPCLGRFTPEKE